MTLEQLTALAQAGFTKQEIISIVAPKPTPTPTPTPTPVQASGTPTPTLAQAQAQAQAQAPGENGVLGKLNELEKILLAGNVGRTNMPEQPSVDDMLAQIINPHTEGK